MSWRRRARLPDELISGTVHGEDVLGFVRRWFDFLPELGDEIVDGPRRGRLLVSPDLVQDLLARDDLAGVNDQIPQQIEFASGEVDALAGAVRLMRPKVDLHVADAACLEP